MAPSFVVLPKNIRGIDYAIEVPMIKRNAHKDYDDKEAVTNRESNSGSRMNK